MNEKAFLPCRHDYQDLEDNIIWMSEGLERMLKSPDTFTVPYYPEMPNPLEPIVVPYWEVTSDTTVTCDEFDAVWVSGNSGEIIDIS